LAAQGPQVAPLSSSSPGPINRRVSRARCRGQACVLLRVGCCLTIRSSGPLRRVAVLSCGGQQRPLNSSVRPHGARASMQTRGSPVKRNCYQRPVRAAQERECNPSLTFSRACVVRRAAARKQSPLSQFAAPRSEARSRYGIVRRLERIAPSQCSVASGCAACKLGAMPASRPNYSFNATVTCRGDNPAPRAAR
jgi:hypothetical protein